MGAASVIRADARDLPLPDASVDLIITSPPYFGLRSYTDGGEHYAGQIGSEGTPGEWLDALWACTAEWVRVLKPEGSLFVNLGDKYSQRTQTRRSSHQPGIFPGKFPEFAESWAERAAKGATRMPHRNVIDAETGAYVAEKSLMGLPWRYAIGCTDRLGLILRAEIVWAKPNGLPESVTDRVRRAHEQVFHFTRLPRYYAAVDEIREPHTAPERNHGANAMMARNISLPRTSTGEYLGPNPLGKLPGSVWHIPSRPLQVPASLGVDHFAAFPMELPRQLVLGWSPPGVCTVCGQGRRPVSDIERTPRPTCGPLRGGRNQTVRDGHPGVHENFMRPTTITGYACGCPEPSAPTRPSVILDPFGGTGTTALVASVLGRHGITADLSADYCRLAAWRTSDPGERARAMQVPKPPPVSDGQEALFSL